MFGGFRGWLERVLEKPFYDAELIRVEILKENRAVSLRLPKNLLLKLRVIHH